ncbi:unnamed protein product [Moneuplotes crassus]|uniref:Uncharacterized protein n=1 Tax=Euplotes crassus TaxID=5936 RepID=A0AAD2CZZ9_EUPCR|nr:unnamed protein product [Moneuplotes crassus]
MYRKEKQRVIQLFELPVKQDTIQLMIPPKSGIFPTPDPKAIIPCYDLTVNRSLRKKTLRVKVLYSSKTGRNRYESLENHLKNKLEYIK